VIATRVSPGPSCTLRSALYLAPTLAAKGVIVVGFELSGAANFEVAVRVLEVQDEQAALRPAAKVLRLQPGAVHRHLQLVLGLVVEEPDLGQLRESIGADRGKRRDLRVEKVSVGVGEGGHALILPARAYFRHVDAGF
jgi:hypothetical protein